MPLPSPRLPPKFTSSSLLQHAKLPTPFPSRHLTGVPTSTYPQWTGLLDIDLYGLWTFVGFKD